MSFYILSEADIEALWEERERLANIYDVEPEEAIDGIKREISDLQREINAKEEEIDELEYGTLEHIEMAIDRSNKLRYAQNHMIPGVE